MTSDSVGNIVLYQTDDGKVTVNVRFEDETFWLTQKAIAELFDVQVPAIAKHLKNIFDEDELDREATVSKMEIVQTEGSREVTRRRTRQPGTSNNGIDHMESRSKRQNY